jgi:hypothetical protein
MSRQPSARRKPARRSIASGVMTKFSRGAEVSCVLHTVRSLVLPPMRSTPCDPQPQQRAIVCGEEVIRGNDGGFVAQPDEVASNRTSGVLIVDAEPRHWGPVLCGRRCNERRTAARKANEKSTPVHGRNGTLTRAERNPRQRGGFARAA